MEREQMGDVDTAQASDTEPEPRWGGWANVRKSTGSRGKTCLGFWGGVLRGRD